MLVTEHLFSQPTLETTTDDLTYPIDQSVVEANIVIISRKGKAHVAHFPYMYWHMQQYLCLFWEAMRRRHFWTHKSQYI